MPFIYKYDRQDSNGGRPPLVKVLLADSTTFTVGEALKATAHLTTAASRGILWGAGGSGLGILHSFVKADGSPVTDNGAGGKYVNSYRTPASNTVYGLVDVSKTSVYSVEADDVLDTTAGSSKPFNNFDCIAASNKIDESTVAVAGTTESFISWGVDPDPKAPANSLLVSIQESQIDI
jgi:hypothetical protein